jgi:hypothetical protein
MRHNIVSSFFMSPILTKLPHPLVKPAKMAEMPILLLISFAILCFLPMYSTAELQEGISPEKLVNSDANGVTIELEPSDLRIEEKEFDGTYYHLISYNNCAFTSESGKPKLPVSNLFLGVPPSASISISIAESKYTDASGYLPLPVPKQITSKSSDSLDSLIDEFTIDRDFYGTNAFYPSQIAQIVYEGNIRHQRAIILQIRPIQYNPALRLLRKYTKLVVRVNFSSSMLAPSKGNSYQDTKFENAYKILLNYDSAKNWRSSSSQNAPAKPKLQSLSPALKLYISQRGIYKLDYATLKGAGIDPSVIDPRTFKVLFLDSQVPIYVYGEADGKFDKGDYIEFFGAKPKSIYTRWNVYWLTWGEDKGDRMVQKSGIPSAPAAKEVTFFKSKIHFEEDLLHHKLQNVGQDSDNPELWFESRDHWFWAGIENGSPKNEVTVNFPVYDLAQSLAKPDFKVELVGCTNFEHEVMVSVNGNRAGEEAKWNSQDIYQFDGQIPADAIKEGFDNELRLSRIGSNPSDGSDMDSYPYQVYLNWFEIGYFRKLIAVNDVLEFSTPEQKESKPIASISLENRITLDKGKIPPELNIRLKALSVSLSENAIITMLDSGNKWMLIDNQQTYFIIKEMDKLSIYANEINDYAITGFLDKDVEVFQISNSSAVSKFKDILVAEYKMSQEERERFKMIMAHDSSEKISNPRIPEVAYSATFEDDGNQPFEYIAVSSSSILRPDRIELDSPSNLKSTSNRADYIIISHPMFLDSARKLSEWRASDLGGGFKTSVIDVTDVYDEFGYGMASPHAIKDFLKYAYNNWVEPAPSYVLIFGDATYDFLGIDKKAYQEAPETIGFIPTFYIKSTFGQTAVDHWYSTIDGDDPFPDIYLGRIPVENVQEAEDVIEKIIANETGRVNGQWRKQIVSIADDDSYAAGDEWFQIGLEEVWKKYTPVGYNTTKIYLKDIIKQVTQNPDEKRIPSDVTKEMIIDSFAKGAVIAQYSGHGGRHVWAHEIIFSITDIEELKETEIYPILLVFSCYNGYFDIPGELCMSEGMLRAKKKGVVAMLSATRLTYGNGNIAMDNLIFEGIFKDKLLRIGEVTAISKTRLLKMAGFNSMVEQMYEYTLFGDPASRINLPDYEMQPKAVNASVSSGGKLEVGSAQVVNLNGQPSSINGNATASLILPDGNKESKSVNITNGIMSASSFDIPSNAIDGQGFFKIFGEIGSESVVGGFGFSVGNPLISNINYEIIDDNLQIYAQIDDDAGSSNLKSVVLSWSFGSGQTESLMIYDQTKKAYKIQDPIKILDNSRELTYNIKATDKNGNVIASDQMFIDLSSKPNLNVAIIPNGTEPSIEYTYSSQLQKWGLDVELANTSKSTATCQIQVMAFDGNPDMNKDRILDEGAKLLGEVTVQKSDWTLTDTQTQTSKIFIPCVLQTGKQIVFVWVDPPSNADKNGKCDEENEYDNLSYRILDVADVLLTPSQEVSFNDTSNVIQAVMPSGSVTQDRPMAIERVDKIKIADNQPSISFIPTPSGQNVGFMLYEQLANADGTSAGFAFEKTVLLRMVYEITPIRDGIKKEIGLGNIPDNLLQTEQLDILERTLKERVSNIGIYLWYESANRWARLPSRPIFSAGENLLKSVYAFMNDSKIKINTGSGIVSILSLDENANTPVDEWNINFSDSDHFNVEGVKTGIIKQNGQPYIGIVGEEFHDQNTGIKLKVITGTIPFVYGDILKFKTIEVGTIEADSEQAGVFCLMMNKDNRPPNIKIDIANQQFANGDVVSSEPDIHALISDDNGIDLLSRKIGILMSFDGNDFEPAKPEDYKLRWDPASNDLVVNYAPGKLESGSYEVKIQAYDLNGNLGMRSIEFDVKNDFKLEEKSLINYPNPFERETDITFHLSSVADDAVVKIYTVSGRLIKTLEEHNVVNFVMIHWDGRDEDEKEVANGAYYYKLRLKSQGRNDIVEIGKMMKLK